MSKTNLIVVADRIQAYSDVGVRVHADLFSATTLFEAVIETTLTGRNIVVRDESVTNRPHIIDVWNARGLQYLNVFYKNIEVRESDIKAIHVAVRNELAREDDRMTEFLKSFNPMGEDLSGDSVDCESAINSGFERAFPFAEAILGRMVHMAFKKRTDNGCF